MVCWALFSLFVICYFYCTHDNNAGGRHCISCTPCILRMQCILVRMRRTGGNPSQLGQLGACAIVSSGRATFSIMNGAVALFSIHYLRVLSANLFRQQTSGGQRIRTLARPLWWSGYMGVSKEGYGVVGLVIEESWH